MKPFIAQPLSLLKNKIIRITNLKSDFLSSNAINVSIFDDTVQIDVVNSEKPIICFLRWFIKEKMNELRQVKINENQASTILN